MASDNKNGRPVYGERDAHFNIEDVLAEDHVSANRDFLRGTFRDRITKDKEKIKDNVYKRLEALQSDQS